MDEIKRYCIQYSEAAEEDIFTKAEYIEKVYRDMVHAAAESDLQGFVVPAV